MITLKLGLEYFDDESSSFITEDGGFVDFEYSLKALYNWEAKWKIPFLKGEINEEQLADFYKQMALQPIDDKFLTIDIARQLSEYIQETETATVFASAINEGAGKPKKPKIHTAEELYALMFSAGVDIAFENRNLNRLLIVLKIIGSYNEPPKKMSKQDIFKQNASLNAQRKAEMKTKG